jgi:hypothetical protein
MRLTLFRCDRCHGSTTWVLFHVDDVVWSCDACLPYTLRAEELEEMQRREYIGPHAASPISPYDAA